MVSSSLANPHENHLLLAQGADQLGISLNSTQRAKLLDYLSLLIKWNAVYNLTAIRASQQMLIQHLLDSLAIVPRLAQRANGTLLDVGSGGGLPGLAIAIALPDRQVTLNDKAQKKTAFLTQVQMSLELTNVSVITGRVETLRTANTINAPFNVIVSRAFTKLTDFVALTQHLLASGGALWAMKGSYPDVELTHLPATVKVEAVVPLKVPFLNAQRHLIEMMPMTTASSLPLKHGTV